MKSIGCLCLIFLGLAIACGCSDKKEESKQAASKPPDPVTGVRDADFVWGKEAGQNLTFYYQPIDSLKAISVPMKDKLVEVYGTIAGMLDYAQPEPIEFYCYKDAATLTAYTGRGEPFYIGNKFYYGYGPAFGQTITEFVLSKLPGGPTQFAFIAEGLPLLLDFSSRNYHSVTNNFVKDGSLTPVRTLTDNAQFATLQGGQKLIESASLCAFIMYRFGYDQFMQIYHGSGDFETIFKKVTGTDLDQLQKEWQAFLPENAFEKEAEKEKSGGVS
jgi:hypothetical protein